MAPTSQKIKKYTGSLFIAEAFFQPSAFEGSQLLIQGISAVGCSCWIVKVILKQVCHQQWHAQTSVVQSRDHLG